LPAQVAVDLDPKRYRYLERHFSRHP
jgi:hypothetical protein